MPKDVLEKLVGRTVLIDEGLIFTTYGLLSDLDLQHLKLSPAIRIGVDDGGICGFKAVSDYGAPSNYNLPPNYGRIILDEELREYYINRSQAKRILPYELSPTLLEHLSETARKRLKEIFSEK